MKIQNLVCTLALATGIVLLPAVLKADDSIVATNQVKIDNFFFGPQTIMVPVGTKVTWVNKDDIPHTVTSDTKLFASRALDTDQDFSFTFTTPGTNNYYCSMHPKMTGKVIVK